MGHVDEVAYRRHIERVKDILRGDMSELLDHLRKEMEELSSQLRFEEAQTVKERYQLVERYCAKSVIVSQTIGDVDVFGVWDDGGDEVFVNYMHMHRGAVVRSVTLQYRRSMDETVAQLLSYAMAEVERELGAVYDEVIVPEMPDVDMPGVTFIVPQRGDKSKILEVSERNARQHKIDMLKHMERNDPEQRIDHCSNA